MNKNLSPKRIRCVCGQIYDPSAHDKCPACGQHRRPPNCHTEDDTSVVGEGPASIANRKKFVPILVSSITCIATLCGISWFALHGNVDAVGQKTPIVAGANTVMADANEIPSPRSNQLINEPIPNSSVESKATATLIDESITPSNARDGLVDRTSSANAVPMESASMPSEVNAAELEQLGQERFDAKDYQGALAAWLPLADRGVASAGLLTRIAQIYYDFEATFDWDKAALYFRRAAELGDVEAQFYVGRMLHSGPPGSEYIPLEDLAEAAEWYKKAIASDHVKAMNNYALLLYEGQGVDQDIQQAMKLFRRSAEAGVAQAQWNLARHLLEPKAWREPDLIDGIRWLRKAAENGHGQSQLELAKRHLMENGGVEQSLPQAMRWLRKSVATGYADAEHELGLFYHEGLGGLDVDFDEARRLLESAASKNHAGAYYALGVMYRDGTGVEKDISKAIKLFENSSRLGFYPAKNNLGVFYAHGDGVEKNLQLSRQLLRDASRGGFDRAQENLFTLDDSAPLNNWLSPWTNGKYEITDMYNEVDENGYHAALVPIPKSSGGQWNALLPLYLVPKSEFIVRPRKGQDEQVFAVNRPRPPVFDPKRVGPLPPRVQNYFLRGNPHGSFRIAYPPYVVYVSESPLSSEDRERIVAFLENLYETVAVKQ